MDKNNENIHKDHRKRLKKKFLTYGHEVLSEHEFLELLLFFSVPYKNTNELAHELLIEFGSLSGVLEAEYETLRNTDIKDMKDNSACLMKALMSCVHRYNAQKNDITKTKITPQNISIFAKNLFYGKNDEVSYALLLDKECYVKKVKMLSKGTINTTAIYPREVLKLAVSHEEPYMMIMHNHPHGTPEPSAQDIEVTKSLINALSYAQVRLIDHVIVAGDEVVSMAKVTSLFR